MCLRKLCLIQFFRGKHTITAVLRVSVKRNAEYYYVVSLSCVKNGREWTEFSFLKLGTRSLQFVRYTLASEAIDVMGLRSKETQRSGTFYLSAESNNNLSGRETNGNFRESDRNQISPKTSQDSTSLKAYS